MDSLADAFTTISSAFTSGFSLITSNWALAALIGIPIVFGIVGAIIALFRR